MFPTSSLKNMIQTSYSIETLGPIAYVIFYEIRYNFFFNSKTSKIQPVNVSEKRQGIVSVHQKAADSLQRFRPLKCNDRVINGLFHTEKVKMSSRSCK